MPRNRNRFIDDMANVAGGSDSDERSDSDTQEPSEAHARFYTDESESRSAPQTEERRAARRESPRSTPRSNAPSRNTDDSPRSTPRSNAPSHNTDVSDDSVSRSARRSDERRASRRASSSSSHRSNAPSRHTHWSDRSAQGNARRASPRSSPGRNAPGRITESEENYVLSAPLDEDVETVIAKKRKLNADRRVDEARAAAQSRDATVDSDCEITPAPRASSQQHRIVQYKGKDGKIRQHTWRALWECACCNFYCKHADEMEAHLRSPSHRSMYGKNLPDAKFVCPFCHKKLTSPNEYQIHLDSKAHKRNLKFYGGTV